MTAGAIVQYVVANGIWLVAGVATLVVFTRAFSPGDYGRLSLMTAAVGLVVVLGTAGFPQSAVRFHGPLVKEQRERELAGTLLLGGAAIAAAVAGLGWALTLAAAGMLEDAMRELVLPAGVLVFCTCLGDQFLGIVRARHEANWYNWGLGLRRLLALAGSVVLVFGAGLRVAGFLWGQAIGEAVACALLLRACRSRMVWRLDRNLLVRSLAYGVPHVFVVGAALVLSVGDRYVVQYFLGPDAVGIYVVGYSVAATLSSLVTRPLNLFLFPAYTRTWEAEGAQRTSAFLAQTTQWFLAVYVPLALGLFLFQEQVIAVLAPQSYAAAASIMGVVFLALTFQGLSTIGSAGLYLTARTWEVGVVILAAAALNVALNAFAVPQWGLWGAAIVTLVTYAVQYLALMVRSVRILPVSFPLGSLGRYVMAGAVMVVVTVWVIRREVFPLVLGPSAGMFAYVATLLLLDPDTRALVSHMMRAATGARL